MAWALFEGYTEDHLVIWVIPGIQPISLVVPERNEVTGTFNIDALGDVYRYLEDGATWREAITYIFTQGEPITQRYTAIFWDLINIIGVIVQFDSLEFLQGAISLCQWFRVNWRDQITDIHDGDTAVEIVNV
jgi:hypothetical protein